MADALLQEGWMVTVFAWRIRNPLIRQSERVLFGDIGLTKKMIQPD